MELLVKLFESVNLPTDTLQKVETMFTASVNEAVAKQVADELVKVQESATNQLNVERERFLTENEEALDVLLNDTVLEWATTNAVAIDATIKTQLAEELLESFKDVITSKGYALSNPDTKHLLEQSGNQAGELIQANQDLTAKLKEAQEQVKSYRKAEIIAEATDKLSEVASERVAAICVNLPDGDMEVFKESVKLIASAFNEKKDNNDPDGDTDKSGIDNDGDSGDKNPTDDKKPTNESVDIFELARRY